MNYNTAVNCLCSVGKLGCLLVGPRWLATIPCDWPQLEKTPEAWQSCGDESSQAGIDRSLPDMKARRSALTQTHFPTLSLHHMF